jgi:hypothetical protein
MAERLFNLFNDNPTLITHCPVCNSRYNPIEARILEENNETHLVHVRCRGCLSAVLALIITNNVGVSSIGLITDLDSNDVIKFRKMPSISCDDVIEAHQVLTREKALIDYFIK